VKNNLQSGRMLIIWPGGPAIKRPNVKPPMPRVNSRTQVRRQMGRGR
jgi:hypothetical protein